MTAFGKFAKAGLGIRLALALIIVGTILLWGKVAAHDNNTLEKWAASVIPATTSVDTNYAWAILSAANDYNSNTDLTVNWCNSPCGNIKHYEADYGPTNWVARAYYHGPSISYATIRWNAFYGPFDSDGANFIARHEMGHPFGILHVPCSGRWSIMMDGCSGGLPNSLTDHDIEHINDKY